MAQIDVELFNRFKTEIYNDDLTKLEDSLQDKNAESHELDWKLFFQAQHLGLKTRLMDWSLNWKIGLLFCVENETDFGSDGQFWVFFCPKRWRYNYEERKRLYAKNPFEINEPHMVHIPFLLDEGWEEQVGRQRVARQSGRFFITSYEQSVSPIETIPEIDQYIIKFIIDGEAKRMIKKELEDEGITLDWAYYRNQENVDATIKNINDETIDSYLS